MKKIKFLSLALALLLVLFCFAACKDKEDDGETIDTESDTVITTDTEAFTEPETIEPAPDVTVDDGKLTSSAVVDGGKVYVTVSISGNPGFAAFNLELGFDTAVLCPVNVEGEGYFSGSVISNTHQSDDIVRSLTKVTAFYSAPSNYSEDGALFTAEFDILDASAGTTEITLGIPTDGIVNDTFNALIFEAEGTTVTLG